MASSSRLNAPRIRIETIALLDLIVRSRDTDPTGYQRKRDDKRVSELEATFDLNQLDPIVVTPIGGGKYAVLDGGHRVALLERLGYEGAPCRVVETADLSQEARAMLDANTNSRALTAVDTYYASLRAGDPAAIATSKTLGNLGLTPGGNFKAIATVLAIYNDAATHKAKQEQFRESCDWPIEGDELTGADAVDETLTLATRGWADAAFSGAYGPRHIRGLARLLITYGPQIDRDVLVTVMRNTNPEAIVSDLKKKVDAVTPTLFAEALKGAYNSSGHASRRINAKSKKTVQKERTALRRAAARRGVARRYGDTLPVYDETA